LKVKDFRVWWAGSDLGWLVDTQIGLSKQSLAKIAEFTLHTQRQRLRGLAPGTMRDECLETITALEMGRISQNIAGTGDRVLFDAYKSNKVMVEV
jgi:hypothetical protein